MVGIEEKQSRLISRAKGMVLVDESHEASRAVTGSFPPCVTPSSLLEASTETARNATSGDVVLLSPARSSWNQSQDNQFRGEVLNQALESIGWGVCGGTPKINGKTATVPH